ncbi:carbohydrate binding family 9 domain-containing protein [Flagellimonas lutimaris]|nr:carbohydrate binding family 9 domain-containing protein [Allomuricauda lutimaris]
MNSQNIFSPSSDPKSIEAVLSSEPIKVDGKLDEAIWQNTARLANFTQIEPNQGEPSKFNTYVQVVYDDKYLYIGAFCEDLEGKKGLRVPDLGRDFSFRSNDTFAVGIDGFHNQRNTVTFATNPYGTQKDYLSFDDTYFDSEWNGLWKVRTSITDKGWYAEFRIPWKTIRYGKTEKSESIWGINFVRQRRKSNEISAWSPYPRAFGFNRAEYFGRLVKVKAPKPTTNLQVNPYTLMEFKRMETNGVTEIDQNDVRIGGDLKWAINSNTLFDFTINTDFAQAEADRQVNNISRFTVFFPERRQFFLENASLFGQGLYNDQGLSGNLTIVPFFSRRIGLSNDGSQIPIDMGGRLVHQSNKRSLGVMGVKERETTGNGSAYNFVGRYIGNFGKQNRIGVIGTLKSTDDGTNIVSGMDGFFRLDKSNSIGFQMLGSHDTTRDDSGFGGYIQYRYDSNLLNGWVTQSMLTKEFNPALGFISREDVMATSTGLILNYRGDKLPLPNILRAFRPRVVGNWYLESSTGRLTEREITVSPFWIEAQNGAYFSFSARFINQNIYEGFFLLNEEIDTGSFQYNRYSFGLGTDPSSKISTGVNYGFGKFYNGSLETIDLSISAIPLPNISIRASLNNNSYSSLGSMQASRSVNLLTLEGKVFVNPRIALSGLYQKNNRTGSDFYNLRLAWEYGPLSYFYVVLNSNKIASETISSIESQGIIKLSFLKQF